MAAGDVAFRMPSSLDLKAMTRITETRTSGMDPDQGTVRAMLLRREALISMPMSAIISIAFLLIVFGWHPVTAAALAFDFFPQTLGIVIFGTIVPSLNTMKRVRSHVIDPAGPMSSPVGHIARLAMIAVAASLVLGGAAALLLTAFGPASIEPLAAAAIKAIYGAAVGGPVTLLVLRSQLGFEHLRVGSLRI